ncbi:class I SAM-dependent methyltransferase [Roseovarius sp. SYSU LYC5161]|uniref:class I SAM-dependent methyltransferase n=1 Tax=Roseovarius halophilus (ex Wu et al. 2025) TaxID=3376060 RepID=UPI00399B43B3
MTVQEPQHALYYTDALLENLQLRWGAGFLSPGGAPELARMLDGLDVAGRTVLDLGCGIGGYDVLLVEEHGAAHVTGVDIDAASLAQAEATARRRGLQDRLRFRHVAPGPLPFADASFGMVFSKDSIVDLPDKAQAFAELHRVAAPGAPIVVSDWFRSAAPFTPEMRDWATEGEETYEMDTLDSAAAYVRAAGFTDVTLDDRNAWFRDYARDEHARLKGPLFDTYVARFGKAQAEQSVENARIRALLAEQGQLRPGHIRARKPAAA